MKKLSIDDMDRLAYLSVPDLSPDGRNAAFTVKKASADESSFVSEVRRMSVDEEKFGMGTVFVDSDLGKFAPAGDTLAFLSGPEGSAQIWLCECGKARQLTTLRHGVTDFSWMPDGKALVWEASLWPGEESEAFTQMTQEEKAAWERRQKEDAIVVEDLVYKMDEVGLFDGSFHQIGITSLGGESRLLTHAPFEHAHPAVSPDGRAVVYFSWPGKGADRLRARLYRCSLQEGSEEALLAEGDFVDSYAPVFDPLSQEGQAVVLHYETKGDETRELPCRVSLTDGSVTPLFQSLPPTEEIVDCVVGRNAVGREAAPFCFSEDGKTVYFTGIWFEEEQLYAYDRETDTYTCLTDGVQSVQAIGAPHAGRMLFLKGTMESPAELFLRTLPDGHEETDRQGLERQLTWENSWLQEYALSRPQHLDVPSADGKARICGWYMRPAGAEDGESFPAVLDIHGGPECCYSANFWFEFQYLAARGMAVVYCNPRGSAGYGPAFRDGDCAYGEEAASDLLTFLDVACSIDCVDLKRLGVTGGSYGGYMTNRLIATTDLFAAAVTQRNLCNLATSYGTGDIGFIAGDENFTTMKRYLMGRAENRTSVIRLVDKIHTPLLILHGVNDYRCSFEQAEQLYIAMKQRRPDVPVKLVAFPGQNHGLTRTGAPWAQKAHLKEMADWFEQYLSVGSQNGGDGSSSAKEGKGHD